MTDAEIEQGIDDLFLAHPSEFVAAREKLAAELGRVGRAEARFKVQRLHRPTLSAWIVNLLYREARAHFDELLAAGQGLRAAQDALLSGRGAPDLALAGARERDCVQRLLDDARGILDARGRNVDPAVLWRAANSLRALARVPAEAASFRGRLGSDLEPPGFEALLGSARAIVAAPAPAMAQRASEKAKGALAGEQERLAQEERRRAEEQRREAERVERLKQARQRQAAVLEERRAVAQQRQHEVELAERQAGQAQQRLGEAERALADARLAAEHAAAVVERARLQAQGAAAELSAAQDALAALDDPVARKPQPAR